MRRFSIAAALACVVVTVALGQETPSPSDAEQGRRLYVASCARCHGIEGRGGEGPTLNLPTYRHAADEEALRRIIKRGIPGTEMPGAFYLDDGQVRQVAAYVRALGHREAEPLGGDAVRGRRLFEGDADCLNCHIIDGQGDSLGPELTLVGARRGAEYLKQHIRDPSGAVAEAFLMVRVRTRDGAVLEGMRVNEDAFTLQLRDADNRFHSLLKRDLVELRRQPEKTFMPSYRSLLSDGEIDDLVAYLATLRGPE